MKVVNIFTHELSLIKNDKIMQFVIDVFDKLCPDYFWTCPCSTSGKYHPQVSLGLSGLVRHTKLAVWWGIELLKAIGRSPELRNIPPIHLQNEVIATLLLHDMIKNGRGLNAQGRPLEKGVTGTHGVTLAEKLRDGLIDGTFHLGFEHRRILMGIAMHMGIWTTKVYITADEPKGWEKFIDLIHLADYCASCKVDEIYAILQSEKIE